MPPDFEKFGAVDFLSSDRLILSAWLSEADWPRGVMNIVALEGYLVALLVWPIELPPGAWLPTIWGIHGWKVAAKIEAPASYDKFLRLILGYRQHLAEMLHTPVPSFVPTLHDAITGLRGAQAAMRWSQGFVLALQQGSQGFNLRSPQSIAAVQRIALHASPAAQFSGKSEAVLAAELGLAVRTLVSEKAQAPNRKSAAKLSSLGLTH